MISSSTPSLETRQAVDVLLTDLCEEHGITPQPRIEWSRRMHRTLGRAFVRENLIRLSAWLDDVQARDTLRHELAHIAAHASGARSLRKSPHGQPWQEWAVRLGTEPRATARRAPASAPPPDPAGMVIGLECPSCGARFVRQRVLRGLYCRACGPKRGMLAQAKRGQRRDIEPWAAGLGVRAKT